MIEFWKTLTFWKKIKFLFTLILLLLIVVFSFQNWKNGDLSLVFIHVKIPVTVLIGISLFVGYTISALMSFNKVIAKSKEIKALKAKLKDYMADQGDSL